VTDQNTGGGNKIEIIKNKLLITVGYGTISNKDFVTSTGAVAKNLAALPSFLIGKRTYWSDQSFKDILVDEWRGSCFSGALKVTNKFGNPSAREATCNP
jgi:hypothetical protein